MSKYRIKFIKEGTASYISHLDLLRTMQRTFVRAGIRVKHSEGFNPHPKMVFALPLSVGAESVCELMDFEYDGVLDAAALPERLTSALPEGLRVTDAWEAERKFKDIAWLKITGRFEYDDGAPSGTAAGLREFFGANSRVITKRSKKGMTEIDIVPCIKSLEFTLMDENTVGLTGVISAQNPGLNPELLVSALEQQAQGLKPDFARFRRLELFDSDFAVFK